MVKAYANPGAWRASVRDTRLKEVKVKKSRKKKEQKKEKKIRFSKKLFFPLRW